MMRRGLEPDVITFNALISACEKRQRWSTALRTLGELHCNGLDLDIISYNATMSA